MYMMFVYKYVKFSTSFIVILINSYSLTKKKGISLTLSQYTKEFLWYEDFYKGMLSLTKRLLFKIRIFCRLPFFLGMRNRHRGSERRSTSFEVNKNFGGRENLRLDRFRLYFCLTSFISNYLDKLYFVYTRKGFEKLIRSKTKLNQRKQIKNICKLKEVSLFLL